MPDTTILAGMSRHQTIKPVRPVNRVERITKNHGGSMTVRQASGEEFTIPAEELEMQAFVVMMMIDAAGG